MARASSLRVLASRRDLGSPRALLFGLLGLSVLVRIGAAIYLGDRVVPLPGTADQVSYHNLAVRVLQGYGFSFPEPWWPMTAANAPTAHWSYLYTLYLTGVYALFGVHPVAARLIQAVAVGILQPLLTYGLAQEVFRDLKDPRLPGEGRGPLRTWIGLIAAGLCALYAYFIYYAGSLMTEPFYITGILAILYLSIRHVHLLQEQPQEAMRVRWRFAVLLGILLAVVVLLRQLFLVFVPFLFLWLLWHARRQGQWRSMALHLALAGGILAGAIAPFTLYNYLRFQRFVLLNTNAGYAFYLANHPIYGTRFIDILPRDVATYTELIPQELRHLDEAALDRALLRRAVEIILQDPVRYMLLSLSRIPSYFRFWPSASSSLISNIARVGSFGILFPFMLFGLVRSLRHRPGPALWLLYIFSLVYVGIHLLSWTLPRYRLPVDAVWLLFAAYGLLYLFHTFYAPRGGGPVDRDRGPSPSERRS